VSRSAIEEPYEWASVANAILGRSKPADEFILADRGRSLIALLKTDDQLAADVAAQSLDETHGEIPGLHEDWAAECGAAVLQKKSKAPGVYKGGPLSGNRATVMGVARDLAAIGPVDVDELLDEAAAHIPLNPTKRGEDRRHEYAAKALRLLVKSRHLFELEDGARIALKPEKQ
jgi:hypothetical protein